MTTSTEGVFTGAAPPLVVSSYTLGTDVPFTERLHAAAAAGFDGIGLRAENYWDAQNEGLDDEAMKGLAEQHGVKILEVEYITAWGTSEDRDAAQQAKERTVIHMARSFGVKHLNTGLLEKLPVDVMSAAFADLCRRAGSDLVVALEFMPYSGVPDLATAWRILQDAGSTNSGLIVDTWHWARAGTSATDLDADAAGRIVAVQLCDVQETPMEPARTESLAHRLPPGQGYGDTVGFLGALQSKRVEPWIVTAEVISDELVSHGVDVAARTVASATSKVLAQCRQYGSPS